MFFAFVAYVANTTANEVLVLIVSMGEKCFHCVFSIHNFAGFRDAASGWGMKIFNSNEKHLISSSSLNRSLATLLCIIAQKSIMVVMGLCVPVLLFVLHCYISFFNAFFGKCRFLFYFILITSMCCM